MGRKKALGASGQQAQRPFCFFCDRTFDDETVLLQHQRAKHFRCPECDDGAVRGKCESVQGLIVHTLKVHGKSLSRVPNALQGRDNPELNVYGMDGIPGDILEEKGFSQPKFVGDQQPPAPKISAAGLPPMPGLPPGMLPPPGMPGLPPGLPGLPPGMPPPPGFPGLPGLPGLPPELALGAPPLPGFPGVDLAGATGLAACSSTAPGAAATAATAPLPGGPSLEGFQQFLAQQGLRPPSAGLDAPPPQPAVPGQAPLPGQPPMPGQLPPLPGQLPLPGQPPLPGQALGGAVAANPGGLLSGMPDGQALGGGQCAQAPGNAAAAPLKRSLDDDPNEDVSVEEKRARMARYGNTW